MVERNRRRSTMKPSEGTEGNGTTRDSQEQGQLPLVWRGQFCPRTNDQSLDTQKAVRSHMERCLSANSKRPGCAQMAAWYNSPCQTRLPASLALPDCETGKVCRCTFARSHPCSGSRCPVS